MQDERLLGEHGIHRDRPAGRRECERPLERRRLEDVDADALEQFRQAGSIGLEAFRQEGHQRMEGKVGESHPGPTGLETAAAEAERIVAGELGRRRWTHNDLGTQPKRHPRRLASAARLRQETSLSVKPIAQRQPLGKPKGARTNLDKGMNSPQAPPCRNPNGHPMRSEINGHF